MSRDSDATQGIGPPPPGLHRGKIPAGSGGAAGEPLFAAGAAAGTEAGGTAGGAAAGQGCTLIGELPPPGSRSDTSFSGTETELFGSFRSNQ
jgi:hypothetical protein